MTEPVLVFDLDGTLADTAPDLLESLNYCLLGAGYQSADPTDLRRFVGHGGRMMITRAVTAQGGDHSDPSIDRLLQVFLEHYAANIPGKSVVYPGLHETVNQFSQAGYRMAVCTNKFQHLSEALIDGLGIGGHFAAICGSDRFEFKKPDRRHLTETIREAGGDPARSVMIGDSKTDIDTARAAEIPVVAVDWGYTDEHVSTYAPDVIISHYDELTPRLVHNLIDKRR